MTERITIAGKTYETLPSGTVLEGLYRIESLLGHGNMGAIYRGSQTRTGRILAIKENFVTTPEGIAQFEREGQILVHLDRHPHLPLVYDVIIAARQYLVMEFIDGQTLSERLTSGTAGQPLPQREALTIMIQVCEAVKYLHTRPEPVIHRDIKPQNIKIKPDGQIVLVDFGLAKVGGSDSQTTGGAQGLTAGFAPPEQYTGQSRTRPVTDIYALGATLYALVTATRPPDSLQRMLGDVDLQPPQQLNPDLTDRLCRAIEHAMQLRPVDRPASVTAWQAELQTILADLDNSIPFPVGGVRAESITTSPESPSQPEPAQSEPPATFTLTRPFPMEFVRVPAGEFLMGSDPARDKEAYEDEQSQHTVTLPAFYIAKYPVTNAQYAAFVKATNYDAHNTWKGNKFPDGGEAHPATYVFWKDTVAFCQWLSRECEYGVRLPTEAEWEKAARGEAGRIYPWGDAFDKTKLNSSMGGQKGTTAVGDYSPLGDSPYGAADMAGNVWEWCSTIYGAYPFEVQDEWTEAYLQRTYVRRVLRGGAFNDVVRDVRCASRFGVGPDYGDFDIGVRVCVSLLF